LKKLADHLEKVPRRGFDMDTWMRMPGTVRASLRDMKKASENDYKCGMTACVGGHAALLFPDIKIDGWIKFSGGLRRMQKGLGLTRQQADELCNHMIAEHRTPKAAAKYIRKLIASHD